MAGRGQNTFDVSTPAFARGRGLFSAHEAIRSKTTVLTSEELVEPDDFADTPPLEPLYSTPAANTENTTQQLRDLIGELGSQIGESIASCLLASQLPFTSQQPPSTKPARVETQDTTIDLSKVSLVVKPDVREPPVYRGDGKDNYSIQEWIDMMDVYLHKRGFSANEQRDEILNHLLGKAKSIVKVGLKSSSPSGTIVNPETIYGILRRYFSETPGSCLPLADFYATQPTARETPVDYWVRLNTVAEAADRHLRRQGSNMGNMDAEIAMMFIRNCPDPSLACVFKCKPLSKWTLSEVQEVIDEHQRECQVRDSKTTAKAHVLQVATAVTAISSPEPETDQAPGNTAKFTLTNPAKPSETAIAEQSALERVLNMLERVLERTNLPVHSTLPQSSSSFSPALFMPCRVCGDKSHSTRTHCMKEKRCLSCLEQGHQRKDCPQTTLVQHGGSSPDQGN